MWVCDVPLLQAACGRNDFSLVKENKRTRSQRKWSTWVLSCMHGLVEFFTHQLAVCHLPQISLNMTWLLVFPRGKASLFSFPLDCLCLCLRTGKRRESVLSSPSVGERVAAFFLLCCPPKIQAHGIAVVNLTEKGLEKVSGPWKFQTYLSID